MLSTVFCLLALFGAVVSGIPALPNCVDMPPDMAKMFLCQSIVAFIGNIESTTTAQEAGVTVITSTLKVNQNLKDAGNSEYTIREEFPFPCPDGLPTRSAGETNFLIQGVEWVNGQLAVMPCHPWDCMEATLHAEVSAANGDLSQVCDSEVNFPFKKK